MPNLSFTELQKPSQAVHATHGTATPFSGCHDLHHSRDSLQPAPNPRFPHGRTLFLPQSFTDIMINFTTATSCCSLQTIEPCRCVVPVLPLKSLAGGVHHLLEYESHQGPGMLQIASPRASSTNQLQISSIVLGVSKEILNSVSP